MRVHISLLSILFGIFMIFLASCNGEVELEPTATNTATITPRPTGTSTPTSTQTNTPEPTATKIPTETPSPTPTVPTPTEIEPESDFPLPIPSGEPATKWEGIPIMPDATAGEEDKGSYYYTVEVPVDDVKLFYEKEMGKYGWSLFVIGEGENGSLMLMFQKNTDLATISVFELEDGSSYVFIVK